jgi:anti-sigma factor RsiW
MRCHEVKEKLSAYLDKELEPSTSHRVTGHLDRCPRCKEDLQRHENLDNLLQSLPVIDAGPDLASKLLARVKVRERDTRENLPMERGTSIFARLAESLLELFKMTGKPTTRTLDEFGDFPPLSLSFAYFSILGDAGGR